MPTNLAIDDRLLDEARRIGGRKTKPLRSAVERLLAAISFSLWMRIL